MSTPANPLILLATQLKACPTQDSSFSEKLLAEAWERFKHTGWERGSLPSTSVIAGLLVHDENVARLLTSEEHTQLLGLCSTALERYHEKANPPNPVGKTIAATLNETI